MTRPKTGAFISHWHSFCSAAFQTKWPAIYLCVLSRELCIHSSWGPRELQHDHDKLQGSRRILKQWPNMGETQKYVTIANIVIVPHKQTTNSVALSQRANYTDWATATCRRNLVPTFADRGVSRGQRGGSPTVVNLSFLDRSCYFSFK
jgi:hypothetical protein